MVRASTPTWSKRTYFVVSIDTGGQLPVAEMDSYLFFFFPHLTPVLDSDRDTFGQLTLLHGSWLFPGPVTS